MSNLATHLIRLAALAVLLHIQCLVHAADGTTASDAARLFTLKVKPLLGEKCFACHGEDPAKIEGELNLLTREGLLKGGESFDDILVPGDAANSFIMTAIKWEDEDYEMPPKANDRLTESQIALVAKWIDAGAPWPNEQQQEAIRLAERQRKITEDGVIIETSGGLGDDWTFRRYQPDEVWSFRPVVKPAVPNEAAHPIDAFIDRRLAGAKLEAAARADRRTLLRRATFDLLGLPPTPEELEAFLAAKDSDAAWDALIDRLLTSPHYGERWGQHWLDVARYADTSGFSNDFERSNAWRYRDYVIRSFNNDKPYNEFVVEQLAGDELQPENPEMKIAVGFLRSGPWEHTGMVQDAVSRQQFLDDVVNGVGQTFLSTTMRCFKCHDHKFDPLPTRDYYRVYAAFAATQPAEMAAEFLPDEDRNSFEEERRHVQNLLNFATRERQKLLDKREAAAKAWYAQRELKYLNYQARLKLRDVEKPARFVGLSAEEEGQLKVREQDVKIWNRCQERFKPLAQSVYNGGRLVQRSDRLRPPDSKKKSDFAQHKKMPETFIYAGGSVFAQAGVVKPGVLSAISLRSPAGTSDDPYALPTGWDQRRLNFANWTADAKNPLTTRSIVNRVWHYHFGRGIAGNPNNFGGTGKKPTHPELLDWLAATFVERGWSIKKLHKLIMTSRTYQLASSHPDVAAVRAVDPDNDLYAVFKPRRLTAEELRDSMLSVTGELNPNMGGLPIRPEINLEVALSPRMIQSSLAPAYQPSRTPAQRHRRSIYAYRIRGLSDPLMEVFNKPNSADSCEHRDAPSVTPQVFSLLNSDAVTNRSIAFALRLEKQPGQNINDRISRAFELALNRKPRGDEIKRLGEHYGEMVKYHRNNKPKARVYPTRITRSLVEEFSGDKFEYEERLDIYEDWIRDPQPADVSHQTRALADVCMLLFNTNEFIFVY